ncbi:MAG: hypothetical protein HND58_08030 [Planctomycetota bacterium]|nr:MAG: hypothetical protein HND58_08030 [Planctomycetota bacterium]
MCPAQAGAVRGGGAGRCRIARRTAPSGSAGSGGSRFLLDTLGELRQAYSLADVAVVGRSFFDQHGSDPIEPIALGCPTIIGPAVSDFAEIVRVLEEASGLVRADRDDLGGVIAGLLGDAARRGDLVANGRECIRGLQGGQREASGIADVAGCFGRGGRAAGAGGVVARPG